MDRRRVLHAAVLAVGFAAGCVSDGPGAGSGPATDEGAETTTTRTEAGAPATTRARTTDEPLTPTENADTPTAQPAAEATVTPAQSAGETTAIRTDGRRTRTTEQTPTMTENTDETADSSGDVQRRLSLADVDDIPDEHELTITVELLESTVTADHTAHLRVTATDETSRKRRITIGTGRCDLFNRDKGQSEPKGLWLHAPSSSENIERAGERWTADRDPDAARGFPMYGCGYLPSVHDEPIVNEYLVWDDYQVEGYMAPGTYRFATSITVGGQPPGGTTTTATEPASEFTWGFDLAVENPNA